MKSKMAKSSNEDLEYDVNNAVSASMISVLNSITKLRKAYPDADITNLIMDEMLKRIFSILVMYPSNRYRIMKILVEEMRLFAKKAMYDEFVDEANRAADQIEIVLQITQP